MDAKKLRELFLTFFKARDHALIGGASLIPEHDPSVLFTTAGMHPLVPFLLGEPHPAGKRLANVQKCVRTDDIMEVGDDVHLTFFEMLGNWSLGDYWKKGAIEMSLEFLTEALGLDVDRLHVTCFAGDADAPKDLEAAEVWMSLGVPGRRITFNPKADNWWGPAGSTGPCGPDTEMFYDMNPTGPSDETPVSNPTRFWEIWNDVFMQYDKHADGSFPPLKQKNVDTGMGLERTLAIMEGAPSLYETEMFRPIVDRILSLASKPNPFAVRVIADHTRAASFILAEGIAPGKVDQPYIVRRLIRRAVRYAREVGLGGHFLAPLAEVVIETLSEAYPELSNRKQEILSALDAEETRFQRTLQHGEKQFKKAIDVCKTQGDKALSGEIVFRLYDTFGYPPELTQEMASREGLTADLAAFRTAFESHQEKSRQGGAARFRGGLAERSPATTKLHTATHLLHQALRKVVGLHVEQRGSNITVERLRFDFSHPDKLTDDQVAIVESLVNEQIKKDLPVTSQEMTVAEAQQSGAIGLFEERYGEYVKVYSIGDFSKEICGGPHVERTGTLGHFRIIKEEAVGTGIRRIRAVLEPAEPTASPSLLAYSRPGN
jgi:alanyl-tRNA synthetase